MHFNENSAIELRDKIVNDIMNKAISFIRYRYTDPERAAQILGQCLHTIQDSYSRSHVKRDSAWRIIQFQNYNAQDGEKHGKADKEAWSSEYQQAQAHSHNFMSLMLCNQFVNLTHVRGYLIDSIFHLGPVSIAATTDDEFAK